MSDLLAPILFVIDDELDAFWCFVAYMDRVVRKLKKFLTLVAFTYYFV